MLKLLGTQEPLTSNGTLTPQQLRNGFLGNLTLLALPRAEAHQFPHFQTQSTPSSALPHPSRSLSLTLSLTRSLSVSLLPTRNHHATHPPKPSPRDFPPTQRCCFHCYNSDDAPTTTTTGARPLHHLRLPPQIHHTSPPPKSSPLHCPGLHPQECSPTTTSPLFNALPPPPSHPSPLYHSTQEQIADKELQPTHKQTQPPNTTNRRSHNESYNMKVGRGFVFLVSKKTREKTHSRRVHTQLARVVQR